MNKIEKIVTDATIQTDIIFRPTEKQLEDFKRYFEDILLFEVISCKSNKIGFESSESDISDNLKIALIASGISSTGDMPSGAEYPAEYFDTDINMHLYAKHRVKELETEELGMPFPMKMERTVKSIHENPQSFPDAYELVELGISRRERECGYIEENSINAKRCDSFYMGAQMASWFKNEQDFINNNLDNTLAYDICKIVNDSERGAEGYRHYPLATNIALKKMADIDFFVAKEGIESYDNKEELMYVLRNIKAAKITDRELIEPFEARFLSTLKPYMDRIGLYPRLKAKKTPKLLLKSNNK